MDAATCAAFPPPQMSTLKDFPSLPAIAEAKKLERETDTTTTELRRNAPNHPNLRRFDDGAARAWGRNSFHQQNEDSAPEARHAGRAFPRAGLELLQALPRTPATTPALKLTHTKSGGNPLNTWAKQTHVRTKRDKQHDKCCEPTHPPVDVCGKFLKFFEFTQKAPKGP